jgi:hypothetical protein
VSGSATLRRPTRKRADEVGRPGCIEPASGDRPEVGADAYGIDHEPRSIDVEPRLNSSTKSFAKDAPLLPPPA